jgi:hypothetical protein
MADAPHVRAGDGDRERTAELLRRAFAEGRLTQGEFDERLSAAYAAKTLGELAELRADLPAVDPYELPVASYPRLPRSAHHPHPPQRRRVPVGSWLSVSVFCWTIWLVSVIANGHSMYPWPIWVSGPWGAVLLSQWVGRRR